MYPRRVRQDNSPPPETDNPRRRSICGSVASRAFLAFIVVFLACLPGQLAAQTTMTADASVPAPSQPPAPQPTPPPAPFTATARQPTQLPWLPHARFLLTADIGASSAYTLPMSTLGFTVEQPIRSFELQLASTYSPSHKAGGGPGLDTGLRSTGTIIYWRRSWGPCFSEELAWERTANFTKTAEYATPCVMLRAYPFGIQSRLYFGYLVPSGKWAGPNGIESSRTQGLTFYWEARVLNLNRATVRFRYTLGLYRILQQGNPLCDGTEGVLVSGCARVAAVSGNMSVGLELEIPKGNAAATW
jgi:hypothetical protein